jgi:DNA-binding transcriptional LysR family regulator
VFAAAEAMEAAHARLARDVSDVEARAEGTVRITVDPSLAETFIAPALVRLRARHPRITVEIDASPLPRDLGRGAADLAVRAMKVEGADLLTTKVASQPWGVFGSARFVADAGVLRSWEDVAWITWDRDLASFPAARWLERHAGKATVALRTSHFASQLAATASGLGLAVIPAPYARVHDLKPARTSKKLAASVGALPMTDLWLVVQRAMRDVPRVASVWTFLAEELRAMASPLRR